MTNALKPVQQRGLVAHLRRAYQISERRACQVIKVWRSVQRYPPLVDPQEPIILKRMTEISQTRVRHGCTATGGFTS